MRGPHDVPVTIDTSWHSLNTAGLSRVNVSLPPSREARRAKSGRRRSRTEKGHDGWPAQRYPSARSVCAGSTRVARLAG
jgi:hypothetical protein